LDTRKNQKLPFPHSHPISSEKNIETEIMVLIDSDDDYVVIVTDEVKENSFEEKVLTLAAKKRSKAEKIFHFHEGVQEFTEKYPFLYGDFIPHPTMVIEDLLYLSGAFSGSLKNLFSH
jgi:hypothetical protein